MHESSEFLRIGVKSRRFDEPMVNAIGCVVGSIVDVTCPNFVQICTVVHLFTPAVENPNLEKAHLAAIERQDVIQPIVVRGERCGCKK